VRPYTTLAVKENAAASIWFEIWGSWVLKVQQMEAHST